MVRVNGRARAQRSSVANMTSLQVCDMGTAAEDGSKYAIYFDLCEIERFQRQL